MVSESKAKEIKRRHAARLFSEPGVCAVGVERERSGDYVLVVHLDTDDPVVRKRLPTEIEGVHVKPVRGGPFRSL